MTTRGREIDVTAAPVSADMAADIVSMMTSLTGLLESEGELRIDDSKCAPGLFLVRVISPARCFDTKVEHAVSRVRRSFGLRGQFPA